VKPFSAQLWVAAATFAFVFTANTVFYEEEATIPSCLQASSPDVNDDTNTSTA